MPRAFPPLCWWGLAVFWLGGFLFKVMHWPLASFNLLLGTALLGIAVFLRMRDKGRIDMHAMLIRAALATAHAWLLFRLQFWAGGVPVLLIHLVVLGLLLAGFVRDRFPRQRASIAMLAVGVLSASLYFVPAYAFSYAFGVGSPLDRDMRPYSYIGWSQYSWFLYLAGKQERSLAAMDSAVVAAERCVNEYSYDPALMDFYRGERQALAARTWSTFRWPPDEYHYHRP